VIPKLTTRSIALAALAIILALSGCTVLAPQKDVTRFFVLMPVQDGAAPSPAIGAASRALTIGLGPITIPAYVNRAEVVTRVSESELKVSDTDRWGERLDINIARVLAADLSDQLGTRQILNYPWPLPAAIDYSVPVTFQRFEQTADGHVVILANWTIRNGKDGRIVRNGTTSIDDSSGPDTASASQALSRGLAQVSRDIARTIASRPVSRQAAADRCDGPRGPLCTSIDFTTANDETFGACVGHPKPCDLRSRQPRASGHVKFYAKRYLGYAKDGGGVDRFLWPGAAAKILCAVPALEGDARRSRPLVVRQ
jgi:uncharacterized protein